MSATSTLPVQLIDFDSITLVGDTQPPEVVTIKAEDGFFLNDSFSQDFRIRKSIYDMMMRAQKTLPDNYYFMVYESYRPLARQVELWKMAEDHVAKHYPDADAKAQRDMVETFVADPYNGIGSGHQACCAIDISLCDKNGVEYDMGTKCQEICHKSTTLSPDISADGKKNRMILLNALEEEGFANYPPEWWHFSYGDHQWAYLVGKTEAIYGPIDI